MIYQPERLNLSVWLSGVHLLFCWGFFIHYFDVTRFLCGGNKQTSKHNSNTHGSIRFYVCVKINPKINEIKIINTADKKTHHLCFFQPNWCVVLSSDVSYTDGKIVALVIRYSFVNSKRMNDWSCCVLFSRKKEKTSRVQRQETKRAVYHAEYEKKKRANDNYCCWR